MALIRPAIALALAAASMAAHAADSYPSQPVRIVAPFAPGGGADVMARLLAQNLSEHTGKTFVVENRTGAAGMIGTDAVAKAKPDGYTLLIGTQSTQAVAPAMYAEQARYDGLRDFIGITQIANSPLLLVAGPALKAKDVAGMIKEGKAEPGGITFGAASGGTPHIAGEMFKRAAGIDMQFIPYKGENPALTDAMGGQIGVVFSNLPVGLPIVQGGRLRALAVTSPERVPTAPDVPTVAEAGLPGFEAMTWFGLFAPAGTPDAIVNKLNADLVAVLKTPAVKERMATLGLFPVGSSTAEFKAFLAREIPRSRQFIQDAGIKPQ